MLDPQTAGGFLAGLPAAVAPCLVALAGIGVTESVIGTVLPGPPRIRLAG